MKRGIQFAAIALALTLGACGGSPTTVTNSIAATEVALTTAEGAATAYAKLPVCGSAGATAVCSSASVVATIKTDRMMRNMRGDPPIL